MNGSHIWILCLVAHTDVSCNAYECVMSRICISSGNAYECVMSRICISSDIRLMIYIYVTCHMPDDIHMCNTTRMYLMKYICVTRRRYIWWNTYVWDDADISDDIHICDMTQIYLMKYIYVTWRKYIWWYTYVWHDASDDIHICDMIQMTTHVTQTNMGWLRLVGSLKL